MRIFLSIFFLPFKSFTPAILKIINPKDKNNADSYYEDDSDLSLNYGVSGSPTLVIDGEIVNSARDSASYLETICSYFEDQPPECNEVLSDETPVPGFGAYDFPYFPDNSFPEVIKYDCPFGRNQECNFEIDLSEYGWDEIYYYFELTDVAGNVVESKPVLVKVDTTPPVLLNPNDFVWQGEGRQSRYVYFDMEIDEDNFDEVSYIDWEDRRPRERRLCSRLDSDKRCEKKKLFRRGDHEITVYINDLAGNSVEKNVVFSV